MSNKLSTIMADGKSRNQKTNNNFPKKVQIQ